MLWIKHLLFALRNITLLHYLITILEKKYPKVLQFQEDLKSVPEAAKVKYVTPEEAVSAPLETHLCADVRLFKACFFEEAVGASISPPTPIP